MSLRTRALHIFLFAHPESFGGSSHDSNMAASTPSTMFSQTSSQTRRKGAGGRKGFLLTYFSLYQEGNLSKEALGKLLLMCHGPKHVSHARPYVQGVR